jgi:hypothetical protein
MLRADPVMNAEIETRGMRSTIQPHRMRPMNTIMHPAMTARHEAMTCPGTSGLVLAAFTRIFPTRVDITATGFPKVRF